MGRLDSSYIDSCRWHLSTADGVSIERDSLAPPSAAWHQCTAPSRSTPGRANSTAAPPLPDDVTISVQPRSIRARSGQSVEISVSAPAGSHAIIEILDDTARRVLTLCDKIVDAEISLSWDGVNGNGGKLPPGIYFVTFVISRETVVSRTISVVIAP